MPITAEEFDTGSETNKASIDESVILKTVSDGQYYSTREVAEKVFGGEATQGQREQVLNKLKSLFKEGKIASKKIKMSFFWGRPTA